MNSRDELYPQIERSLQSAIRRVACDSSICVENGQALRDFITKLEADGTSSAQRFSYINRIRPIARLLGQTPFKTATKKQMEFAIAEYRRTRALSQNSINKMVECLKAFYRWLYDLSSADPAPEPVRWLRRESEINNIRPEHLWTDEDVTRVINATRSLRNKAMISVAFESGMRPGELRSLRMEDLVFNGDMVRVYCRGKLEKKFGERVVPLIRSYSMLKVYVDGHQQKGNPKAWLWSYGNKPIPEHYFRITLRKLAAKAGVSKPANPLILRHSALTKFYGNMASEVARTLAGHIDSRRAKTYCHLSQEQLENSVRVLNGYEKKQESEVKPLCKRCNQIIELGASICGHCGAPQNNQAALEKMEYEQTLMKIGKALLHRVEKRPDLIKELMDDIQ